MILVFDPGESTGWVNWDPNRLLLGGTCGKNHTEVARKIELYRPKVIVLERFNLYPSMAKSLVWNSFYPCEVIGVLRYLACVYQAKLVEQAPSVKKFSGGLDEDWVGLRRRCEVSEHTKDAFLHLKYYLRNH